MEARRTDFPECLGPTTTMRRYWLIFGREEIMKRFQALDCRKESTLQCLIFTPEGFDCVETGSLFF